MRLAKLLNAPLTQVLSRLGHTDEITLADAGLPIAHEHQRLDLALCRGVPDLLTTLDLVLGEVAIESVILAEEIRQISPAFYQQLLLRLSERQLPVHFVSHAEFKQRSQHSKAVVRTGECTPYANIILCTGVAFAEQA
ncbi:D-ribose pyranase [Balneatrix alpica]|uniref:D-ribose pyranase n=1 Tax=Balneatrix alpica TaxID=75684 RepID=A0ABV5ZDJ5_9GAMM|nr:D-ribose pyranase [Balneatrix alpica]